MGEDIHEITPSIHFVDEENDELLRFCLVFAAFEDVAHTRQVVEDDRDKQQQYVKEFNRLLEYINDNYMQPITLEDAAESIGFSKYYFSRLFKQYTDYTFCDYLTLRRIRAAKELLSDPEYSIMDIAMNTGFSSISTFNRVFKDSEGCTPSAFRAKRSVHV